MSDCKLTAIRTSGWNVRVLCNGRPHGNHKLTSRTFTLHRLNPFGDNIVARVDHRFDPSHAAVEMGRTLMMLGWG